MKKILIAFAMLFSFYTAANAAVSVVAIGAAISATVGVACKVYDRIPTAEYTVEFKADKIGYVKVSSANEAILAAVTALENGADYAHIRSQYATVHSSCRDKRYTKADIEYLRSKL
ncbi:MAG: hypothetical protein IJA09_00250 [Bacteroidales bacterium]|nr:hypothetical protein [Bacteroidales bacterium]MBQ3576557.1 hypothetical protein [Coprobacter sp.]